MCLPVLFALMVANSLSKRATLAVKLLFTLIMDEFKATENQNIIAKNKLDDDDDDEVTISVPEEVFLRT